MESAFWQAVKENDFAVPSDYSIDLLTEELLTALGDTDPEVRDGPRHEALETWIHRGVYSPDALRAMTTRMLENLGVGLGETGTDTVFLRSFSLLVLTEILQEDTERPFLAEAEVRQYMERGLAYLRVEQDVRGYVAGKGWAHTVAHGADFLMALGRHRYLREADLERVLDVCAEKLSGPPMQVYLYEEDERLAYAVLTALRRDLLQLPFLTRWIERLAHPDGAPWSVNTFQSAEQTARYHNLKAFLRSLYFQMRFAAPSLHLAPVLLEHLETALQTMDRGYYTLP